MLHCGEATSSPWLKAAHARIWWSRNMPIHWVSFCIFIVVKSFVVMIAVAMHLQAQKLRFAFHALYMRVSNEKWAILSSLCVKHNSRVKCTPSQLHNLAWQGTFTIFPIYLIFHSLYLTKAEWAARAHAIVAWKCLINKCIHTTE